MAINSINKPNSKFTVLPSKKAGNFSKVPDKCSIHPSAIIHPSVQLGKNVVIEAKVIVDKGAVIGNDVQISTGCFVGAHVEVGAQSFLSPHVTLREKVKLGKNVRIGAGAVVGSDGFGFAPDSSGNKHKIPQIGIVVIEDDVQIGPCTTIDRATLGVTRIGARTIIDELTQVGHNVNIGVDAHIGSHCGVCGSTTIGDRTIMGHHAGLIGHVTIGKNVKIHTYSGVTKSIPDNSDVAGYPAVPVDQFGEMEAARVQLPDLLKRISQLEKSLGIN